MRKIIYKGDEFADYGKYYDPKQINVVIGPSMSGKTFSMAMRNIHIPNIQVYGEGDDVAAILYSTLLRDRASYVCVLKETDFYEAMKGTIIECINGKQFIALFKKYNILLEECEYEEPITIE